jgi:transcriptional regulator of acetoin/glycerol metabolism
MDCLLRYPWPGNVRELENAMERTAILARSERIGPGAAPALPPEQTLAEVEKSHILRTLEWCGWSYSWAAEILGIGRTTLWRKLGQYHIEAGFDS